MEKSLKILKADTCQQEESIKKIAEFMAKNQVRRIFIIDKKQELKGIITTTDIVDKVVAKAKDPEKTKAEEIMTKKVLAINFEDDLNTALEIMNKLKTFVCPVIKNKKLLGVISYNDIISSAYQLSKRD